MRKLLFLGVPGAGKGTQAEILTGYGFKHIGTGDWIRDAFERKDPLLLPYKKEIDSGGLLPDNLILSLIKKELAGLKGCKGYVLDGAVRTLTQAKFVIKNKLADEVFFFKLTEAQAEKRLGSRRVCPKCKRIYTAKENICNICKVKLIVREDDSPRAIKKRFQEYELKTKPILDYLKKNAEKFYEIDASPTIDEINENVLGILGLK